MFGVLAISNEKMLKVLCSIPCYFFFFLEIMPAATAPMIRAAATMITITYTDAGIFPVAGFAETAVYIIISAPFTFMVIL